MSTRNTPADSEGIVAFVDTARRYCKWCESDKSKVAREKLHFDALRAIADVYRAGFLLPDTDACEPTNPVHATKERRKAVARTLAALPFQHYWNIANPSDFEGKREPVPGDLFDDFIDVYAAMIEGLNLFERGQVQAAVYFWRVGFSEHWGRRAVGALHALHNCPVEPEADD